MGGTANFSKAVRSITPMKLSAMALRVTFALACVSGCVERQPAPRAASASREPTLVPNTPQPNCSAETLARATLWAGTIVDRFAMPYAVSTPRIVYDRVARCDRADLEACRSWAEEKISHVLEDSPEALERSVEIGRETRGTMWSVLVDGRREGYLLPTNRDFARTFRELASAGKQVQVTDRRRVVEPRPNRVHLRVTAPSEEPTPAERWTIEFDASEMAVVEVGLALDDLESAGIVVSDRRELDERGWKITPVASTAYLSTPLRDQPKGRERVDVVVICETK